MEKIILTIVAVFMFGVCHAQDGYKINGTVTGLKTGKVLLVTPNNTMQLDTLGQFELKGGKFELQGKVNEPTYTVLMIEDKPYMMEIFLENENFKVVLNTTDRAKCKIEGGGMEQNVWNQYSEIRGKIEEKLVELKRMEFDVKNDADAKVLQDKYQEVMNEKMTLENDLIKANPDASAAANIIFRSVRVHTVEFLLERYNLLSEKGKATKYGKQVARGIIAKGGKL